MIVWSCVQFVDEDNYENWDDIDVDKKDCGGDDDLRCGATRSVPTFLHRNKIKTNDDHSDYNDGHKEDEQDFVSDFFYLDQWGLTRSCK